MPHLTVELRQQLPLLFLVGLESVVSAPQHQLPRRHGVDFTQGLVELLSEIELEMEGRSDSMSALASSTVGPSPLAATPMILSTTRASSS